MRYQRSILRFVGLASILVIFVGCAAQAQRYDLSISGVTFEVEVVDTAETRQTGLMDREELGERHGMLFVFEESELRSFWMKDTSIPLSIAYIDASLIIREIHDMEPFSLEPVPSRTAARYALEVNQGAFGELGIAVGDRLVPSEPLAERIDRAR